MKQRGFTIIEAVLILVAVGILTGVGYVVYQKRFNPNVSSVSPQAIKELDKQDSYYQTEAVTTESSASRRQAADSSPDLKKVTGENELCGKDNYQVIDNSGNPVGCVHGSE